jgi:hypothetical protein
MTTLQNITEAPVMGRLPRAGHFASAVVGLGVGLAAGAVLAATVFTADPAPTVPSVGEPGGSFSSAAMTDEVSAASRPALSSSASDGVRSAGFAVDSWRDEVVLAARPVGVPISVSPSSTDEVNAAARPTLSNHETEAVPGVGSGFPGTSDQVLSAGRPFGEQVPLSGWAQTDEEAMAAARGLVR